MPYIKPRATPFAGMQRLLRGYDFNGCSLARVLSCSEATARDRIRNPEHLTLAELDRINRFGHVPIDELRAAIAR